MHGQLQRIGWGVISTGHIAGVLASELARQPEAAALVAVCSRDRDRARAFADEYGFAKAYGSPAELAADPDVDVVYVASVHNDHLASARACLEAGKAVLVEKPLTPSAAETTELIELARASGVFLMEAVWTRTQPLIRQAVEIAESGEIGDIRHVSANFGFVFDGDESHRLLDPDQAGGAILDLGVYPAHAVDLFLGEPTEVSAYGSFARTGVDAHTAAVLSYPDKSATAELLCSLEVPMPNSLAVYGTRGRIMIDDFFIRPKRMVVHRGEAEPEEFTGSWDGQGYGFEIDEVARCLRAGEQQSPTVPWESTLGVARVLDRWRAALETQETRP